MQFTRLRLSGFKSFVEPAELRIEPGLTGLVGPNGCGKSNLLEALRWVMGEGSPKSLRGGAMDDVIFAGTARRPRRDRADVLLTLDVGNGQTRGSTASDEVVEVLRRIERGAGSAYRIDGRDVRQRDIQLLFADAATGAHSPALVSQGRIGQVIAAKPAERRILLEEAAGISGLHVRRHDAELRLRATTANLLRVDDMLAALSIEATALRRAAKTADRYRALSAELGAVEARLSFTRWTASIAACTVASEAAQASDSAVEMLTAEAARYAAGHAAAAAALPALRSAEAAAAAEVAVVRTRQAELAAERARVEMRRSELAAAAAAVLRDRQREAALAADATAAAARLATEAAALTAASTEAVAAKDAAVSRIAAAEAAAAHAERRLSEAVETHATVRAEAAALTLAASNAASAAIRAAAEAARGRSARDALGSDAALAGRAVAAVEGLDATVAAAAHAAAAIETAELARRGCAVTRDEAAARLLIARAGHSALLSEQTALARALAVAGGGDDGIIVQVRVAPGFEAALAAALGTDLDAPLGPGGPRFWAAAAAPADDPPLPPGMVSLADHVAAPPALARRLHQVGVAADAATADAAAAQLRPGQRLVTTAGQLWRWDGFHATGGDGSVTAEQLRHRARLTTLVADLPAQTAQLEIATRAGAAADAAATRSNDAERNARLERVAADRAVDAARSVHAATLAAHAKFVAQAEALAQSAERLDDVAAQRAAAAQAAAAAAAAAPDTAAAAAALAALRVEAERNRAELAAACTLAAGLDRSLAAHRARQPALATERAGWAARARDGAVHAAELTRRAAAIAAELAALEARPAGIAAEATELVQQASQVEAKRQAAADELGAAEASVQALAKAAHDLGDRVSSARETRARAVAGVEHADVQRREIERRCGERFATAPPQLPAAHGFAGPGDPEALAARFAAICSDRDRLGPVNLRAAGEVAALDTTIAAATAERAELDTAVARLRGAIGALNREGRSRLLAAFEAVDGHFQALFATLFVGGAAHLALVDADDPLEAGLEIMAQPPGKKLQSLTLLSGGEQALTAIALIFALFLTTPAPICVLDEVDAPLDDANVERFCNLLDQMAATTDTRFLIVTHNAVTMSRMHRLFGVTMAEPGVSQLVSVDLARAEAFVAAA